MIWQFKLPTKDTYDCFCYNKDGSIEQGDFSEVNGAIVFVVEPGIFHHRTDEILCWTSMSEIAKDAVEAIKRHEQERKK